ncbi:hypothetical protein [Paenibacillus humicola]|uniref:hypothetical protein n=1 Tax=Paenibacillus humicola TaxID=3110540 RepID=UPI00237B3D7B|nr:hypothetical protein [Paenibacillus humicola]
MQESKQSGGKERSLDHPHERSEVHDIGHKHSGVINAQKQMASQETAGLLEQE